MVATRRRKGPDSKKVKDESQSVDATAVDDDKSLYLDSVAGIDPAIVGEERVGDSQRPRGGQAGSASAQDFAGVLQQGVDRVVSDGNVSASAHGSAAGADPDNQFSQAGFASAGAGDDAAALAARYQAAHQYSQFPSGTGASGANGGAGDQAVTAAAYMQLANAASQQQSPHDAQEPKPYNGQHNMVFMSTERMPSSSSSGAVGKRRVRLAWTKEETDCLMEGCKIHGVGNWKKILTDPRFQFNCRTAVDLKDRFRTSFPEEYSRLYPNAKTHKVKRRLSVADGHDDLGNELNSGGLVKINRKERRSFTPEEDARLLEGFLRHGPAWSKIQRDPSLQFFERRSTDLRDRFRNAFPDKYTQAGYKGRTGSRKSASGPSDGPNGVQGLLHDDSGADQQPLLSQQRFNLQQQPMILQQQQGQHPAGQAQSMSNYQFQAPMYYAAQTSIPAMYRPGTGGQSQGN